VISDAIYGTEITCIAHGLRLEIYIVMETDSASVFKCNREKRKLRWWAKYK